LVILFLIRAKVTHTGPGEEAGDEFSRKVLISQNFLSSQLTCETE
jgi:hypothetical protein